ncbi:aminopeptidase P family protein [Candidatus Nitrosotenuis chungbukensis]|uniref:M24 family metallopeptidase n=1 Tax=Candidatus Nitrosotenuis chungbukensis TaxID=1353246 RepID=UPI0005B28BC5|nr:aminopeptidase P family protein [Candidatus Nitrosotenuis chungbukensis]WKT58457.1 aminopeptidase P family protein [Candidatus Nitrosotenuis chungbukensis]
MEERRKRLLKYTHGLDCDVLVSFEPENLYYMTGFWGEAVGILEKNGQTTIISPELEVGRAEEESVDCKVVTAERGVGLISSLASKVKNSRVCTDCQNYPTMESLKKSIPSIKYSTDPFYRAREVKDSKEITILKKASQIIDEMYELCVKKIKTGLRESELQSILMSFAMEREMFSTGYRSTLNPLIIAGGPNGALPHAQVTRRKFARGDMIVVDLTLRYKGYVSDATRTFGLGTLSDNAKEVYEIVKESQKAGLKNVRIGALCRSIDDACRNYIDKKNYGQYFIHSTGHGIGLEVHEFPTISQKSQTILQKDMAITVEPGIYIPKKFGVRIEDSVIVKDRPMVLHKFTKDLVII